MDHLLQLILEETRLEFDLGVKSQNNQMIENTNSIMSLISPSEIHD